MCSQPTNGGKRRIDPAEPEPEEPPQKVLKIIGLAKREGRDILKNDGKYQHMIDIEKRLVDFGNMDETGDMDIKPFGDFFELREKGGLLGRASIRVFFVHLVERNEIVVLKTYKKEANRRTPPHIMVILRSRLKKYLAGEFRRGLTTYTRPKVARR